MPRSRRKPKPTLSPIQIAQKSVTDRERRGIGTSTVERLMMTGEPIDVPEGGVVQRVMDSPLDRLYRDGALKGMEGEQTATKRWEAGTRFHELWVLSAMPGTVRAVNFMGVGGGSDNIPITEFQQRQRDMLRNAKLACGLDAVGMVTDMICCLEYPAAKAAAMTTGRQHEQQSRAVGIEFLKIGLDRLRKHFDGA